MIGSMSSRAGLHQGRRRLHPCFTLAGIALQVTACGESAETTSPVSQPASSGFPLPPGPVFTTTAQIEAPNSSSTLISFTPAIPEGDLDVTQALEVSGYAEVKSFGEQLFVGDGEALSITRYDVEGDQLVQRGSLGFQNQGITWINELFFMSPERAFVVNSDQFEIIEWNPTTMEIAATYDISALQREGWGNEYRGGHLREADGVLFFIWAYNNDRELFVNDFIVGMFDTNSGRFDVLVDPACPASAGFGGFFDEAGDLYLPADSFGGFTYFDGDGAKPSCIRRIRAGERAFDDSYVVRPMDALGGFAPWGLYYAGQGVAYTTAVDPNRLPEYDSVFEFIFDTIHEGYALDIHAGTSERIEEMPPDAVGFESVTVAGQVLIPRSAGAVTLYEVETVQTRVYALDPATKVATPKFTMPGYLRTVEQLR
jgi:hypothetical protein